MYIIRTYVYHLLLRLDDCRIARNLPIMARAWGPLATPQRVHGSLATPSQRELNIALDMCPHQTTEAYAP
jgi:hypothetical protein